MLTIGPRARVKRLNTTGNPPPAPGGPFRGYFIGVAVRTPNSVSAATDARAKALVGELTWAECQPTSADSTTIVAAALTKLDSFLAQLTATGSPYETGKLRIFAGAKAPTWVKTIGGAALNWIEEFDGGTYTIPRVWSVAVQDAYETFIEALAFRLSTRTTRLVDVTIAGNMTVYAEPCIKQYGNATNRSLAVNNGYTRDLDFNAAKRTIDVHHTHFSPLGIVSSFAYNPWEQITDAGGYEKYLSRAIDLMTYQGNAMGAYGVLENNSLGAKYVSGASGPTTTEVRGGNYPQMYSHMASTGQPVQFQSMTQVRMTGEYWPANPKATCEHAMTIGGMSVEMPQGSSSNGWSTDYTNPTTGNTLTALTVAECATLNTDFAAVAAGYPPP